MQVDYGLCCERCIDCAALDAARAAVPALHPARRVAQPGSLPPSLRPRTPDATLIDPEPATAPIDLQLNARASSSAPTTTARHVPPPLQECS